MQVEERNSNNNEKQKRMEKRKREEAIMIRQVCKQKINTEGIIINASIRYLSQICMSVLLWVQKGNTLNLCINIVFRYLTDLRPLQ